MYPSVPSILENALSLESSFHPLLPLNWHVWWSWNKKWWPEEIPSCFWYVSEHLRRTAFWASRFLRLESDGQLLGHEWLRGCLRSGAVGYWWNMRVRFCHRSCGVNVWKYFLCVNKLRSLLMIYNAVMIEPTVVPVPMGYKLYISNLSEEPDSSISFGSEVRFVAALRGEAGKHGASCPCWRPSQDQMELFLR